MNFILTDINRRCIAIITYRNSVTIYLCFPGPMTLDLCMN